MLIDQARRHFDALSSQYDAFSERRTSYLETIDQLVINLASRKPNCQILDIGCGSGRLLKKLSSLANCSSIGIDLSPKMIEICNKSSLNALCKNFFEFDTQDYYDLIVMEFNVLSYLAAQKSYFQAISKAAKMLSKNGGTLVFDVMNPFCIASSSTTKSKYYILKRLLKLILQSKIISEQYEVGIEGLTYPVSISLTLHKEVNRILKQNLLNPQFYWIKYEYSDRSSRLPKILTSHRLYIARKENAI